MNLTFSSKGQHYTVTTNDIFYHNGVKPVFIKDGKHASQIAPRVEIGNNEWARIMQHLTLIDYETYYGRKPLLQGIRIYQLKSEHEKNSEAAAN